MGSFYIRVELRWSQFDIDMPYPFIFDMPVELNLEFMTEISSDYMNAWREFLDDLVYEIDNILLS